MTETRKPLLSRPGPALLETLDKALAATARALPVPSAHRSDLPFAIRDLSRMLTEERGEMARPYWASPRLFSAYLHFFLPWNLYRLAWLLPGLRLPLRENARILDLGSGPFTLPLALWCTRPDLRNTPLHFTCNDLAIQPMEKGLAVFSALAGPDSPWRFRLLRGPMEKALSGGKEAAYDCVMAANVLNELGNERGRAGAPTLERRLDALVARISTCLKSNGQILLVEPGTRLGGKVIALARAAALARGCLPLAPCPHAGPCPMLPEYEEEGPPTRSAPHFQGWCHFTHPVSAPPEALVKLGKQAHLQKDSLALSCLLLQKQSAGTATGDDDSASFPQTEDSPLFDEFADLEALYAEIMEEEIHEDRREPLPAAPAVTGPVPVRVISAPIQLPEQDEPGRYACCAYGLALLLRARAVPSGALVTADTLTLPQNGKTKPVTDRKSGAVLMERTLPERKTTGTESPKKASRPQGRVKPPTQPPSPAGKRKQESADKRRKQAGPGQTTEKKTRNKGGGR